METKQEGPNDDPSSSNGSSEVSIKEEQSDTKAEVSQLCSVCFGEIDNETTLDGCQHTFCKNCIRRWIEHSLTVSCPLCKAPISVIEFRDENGQMTSIPAESLRKRRIEAVENAANHELYPLTEERKAISSFLRDYKRALNTENDVPSSRERKGARKQKENLSEQDRAKTIEQLQSLTMLKNDVNDGKTRKDILMRPEFRRIVYVKRLKHSFIPPVPEMTRITAAIFRQEKQYFEGIMKRWVLAELKAIPVGKYRFEVVIPYVSIYEANSSNVEKIVDDIIVIAGKYDIGTKRFESAIERLKLMIPSYVKIFSSELKQLLSSRLSIGDFCAKSLYTMQVVRFGRAIPAGNVEEVVLDDNEDMRFGEEMEVINVGDGSDDTDDEPHYHHPSLRVGPHNGLWVPNFATGNPFGANHYAQLFGTTFFPRILPFPHRSPARDQSDVMEEMFPQAPRPLMSNETITLDESSRTIDGAQPILALENSRPIFPNEPNEDPNQPTSSNSRSVLPFDVRPAVSSKEAESVDDDIIVDEASTSQVNNMNEGRIIPKKRILTPFEHDLHGITKRLMSGKKRNWDSLEAKFDDLAKYCREQKKRRRVMSPNDIQ